MCFWKVSTFLFQTCCIWNTFITVIFWTLIWPSYPRPLEFGMHMILVLSDHSLPLTLTFIDWVFNGIRLEWNAMWPQTLLLFPLYFLVNLISTKTSGLPVYPMLSWDTPISWTIGLLLLPIYLVIFMITWYMTSLKSKCVYSRRRMRKEENKRINTTESFKSLSLNTELIDATQQSSRLISEFSPLN